MSIFNGDIVTEVQGRVGLITLNRPRALNSLSLGMVRDLTVALKAWQADPAIVGVAIRGSHKEGVFGHFCAGGDIRFLHQAATTNDPDLGAFFTEEYILNHLIHTFGKPYIAFMDGVVMGGGMGISQGGSMRLVTERTRMAMPETNIGLFPDVGGGYFLSRCPAHVGEWLALTGDTIGAADALACGLADGFLSADRQAEVWAALGTGDWADGQALSDWVRAQCQAPGASSELPLDLINHYFALPDAVAIVHALEAAPQEWARATAQTLRKRSPLMLHVVLEQVRRARGMSLAEDLRMERDMVHHCFHLRPGQSETVEGIRALAVDKDHAPRWNPMRVEDVSSELVKAFFDSPWSADSHPLKQLA